jgi:hypothetical protein
MIQKYWRAGKYANTTCPTVGIPILSAPAITFAASTFKTRKVSSIQTRIYFEIGQST